MKILICLIVVFYISHIINFGVKVWQALPIEEERSTPIYITKEIE